MPNSIEPEFHFKRLTDFHLRRIFQADKYKYEAPITAFLSDVVIVSNTALGIVFRHQNPGPYGRFDDGHLIRTSDIRLARKEGRFWVLTTLNSRYVVASFKKELGRQSFKAFLGSVRGRSCTPSILQ